MKLQLPKEEQPRERAIHLGVESLSNCELLALILRTGSNKRNVLELALDVLMHYDTLLDLKQTTIPELQEIDGIGLTKAVEVMACLELGRRLEQIEFGDLLQVTNPQVISEMLIKEMKDYQQEHLQVLYLNTKNYLIRKQDIFIGSLNESIAHPREIFHYAVRYSAAGMIIVHNHPSGDIQPSRKDIEFTKRLVKCGEMMGIAVLDHLIIGKDDYASLKQLGEI